VTSHRLPLRDRDDLRADCARCAGLCCTVLGFAASADFAEDKPARTPCRHLATDFRCGIHAELPERGYPGCVAYDCFGAGQLVVQVTFGAPDRPRVTAAMSDAFEVVRRLQELRWYLEQALSLAAVEPLRAELTAALDDVEALTGLGPDDLAALDDGPAHERVVPLLRRASELARAGLPAARRPGGRDRRGADLSGRDLIGTDLRDSDLSGATLRGALLIGADLRGARLTGTDLLRADLRATDLRGTDLSGALFLTRFQLGAARGDAGTTVPADLDPPAAWGQAQTR
jgi:Pentapeptide repeats (8 copies)